MRISQVNRVRRTGVAGLVVLAGVIAGASSALAVSCDVTGDWRDVGTTSSKIVVYAEAASTGWVAKWGDNVKSVSSENRKIRDKDIDFNENPYDKNVVELTFSRVLPTGADSAASTDTAVTMVVNARKRKVKKMGVNWGDAWEVKVKDMRDMRLWPDGMTCSRDVDPNVGNVRFDFRLP